MEVWPSNNLNRLEDLALLVIIIEARSVGEVSGNHNVILKHKIGENVVNAGG